MENTKNKMKYFYFISEGGKMDKLALISNPESSVVSELYNITQIDGWDAQFQTAEMNDEYFLNLVFEVNEEGAMPSLYPQKLQQQRNICL